MTEECDGDGGGSGGERKSERRLDGERAVEDEEAAEEEKTKEGATTTTRENGAFFLSPLLWASLLLSVPCPLHSFCFGFGLAAPFFPFFSSSWLPGLLMVTREADVVHYIKRKEVLDADC